MVTFSRIRGEVSLKEARDAFERGKLKKYLTVQLVMKVM